MILTYPMLTSTSVSPSAIPGICKALERYIMIYQQDKIIRAARSGGYNIFLSRNRLFLKEKDKDWMKGQKPDLGKGDPFGKPKVVDDKETREKDRFEWEKEKEIYRRKEEEKKVRRAEVRIISPDSNSLSIEPSWLVVHTGAGPAPLGIKVVSYPVKSDVTLAALLTSDAQMKKLSASLTSFDRSIRRFVWKVYSKLPILKFFVGAGTVTGDPKKDIIMEKTVFGRHTLACINYMDLQEDFFQSPGRMSQLFKLGWKDFVIADDVNKRAFFCLKIFKGMCTAVPYSFIYATIDKENVYHSLEDVRRASGPLFRMGGRSSKIFGESVAVARKVSYSSEEKSKMDLTQKYLDEIYLREQVPGDLMSFMKRLTPSKIKSLISGVKKSRDLNAVKRMLSFAPVWSLSKIEGVCRKLSPGFDKSYALTKKVVANSLPALSKDVASLFACGIAFKSSYKNDDPIGTTKKNLKIDIGRVVEIWKDLGAKEHLHALITIGVIATLLIGILVFIFTHPILTAMIVIICAAIALSTASVTIGKGKD